MSSPEGIAPPQPTLLTREMVASLVAVALMFTSLYMLIGVLPIAVRDATGNTSGAGLVTGALAFATIVTNGLTPALMSRFAPAGLLAGSLVVAVGGMAAMAAWDWSFAALLLGGTLVGLGLGVALVVGVSLITSLAPPERKTVAVGLYGVAAGAPAVIGPSAALWLASSVSVRTAFLVAASAGILAIAASFAIRSGVAVERRPTHGFRTALGSKTVRLLVVSFALVTFMFGALLTVIPLSLGKHGLSSAATYLLVFGAARVAVRPAVGLVGVRVANERLYLPALVAGLAGAVLLAVSQAPASLLATAILLGLGFGTFQGASYVGMLEAVPKRDDGVVASLWNFAFDGGVGIGAIAAGLLAGSQGYGASRILLPVAIGLATLTVLLIPKPTADRLVSDNGAVES